MRGFRQPVDHGFEFPARLLCFAERTVEQYRLHSHESHRHLQHTCQRPEVRSSLLPVRHRSPAVLQPEVRPFLGTSRVRRCPGHNLRSGVVTKPWAFCGRAARRAASPLTGWRGKRLQGNRLPRWWTPSRFALHGLEWQPVNDGMICGSFARAPTRTRDLPESEAHR